MALAVKALAPSEKVRINVNSSDHERRARSVLDQVGVHGRVLFHRIPTNDAWIRDYGPIFVRSDVHELVATCWGFNSWGGKYPPYDLDDDAAGRMARELGVPAIDTGLILEGGSIEVNGEGLLLTTESCLLHPNRNPDFGRYEIEGRLREHLGVERVIWLKEGIVGDDTDGHVDDVTRFVGPTRILTAIERDPNRPNYDVLQENLHALREAARFDGSTLEILGLPMPAPRSLNGEPMPASYANFYVGNEVVLMPTFDDEKDAEALAQLRRAFSDRSVVGLYCGDLIWGLGALHCLTQQVPAFRMK